MKTKRLNVLKIGGLSLATSFWALISLSLPALAFSGYGAGTSTTPYRIGSCSQLGEINNKLSGYYILVSNIDCSAVSNFTSIGSGTAFSGTFDGQGHTIKGLTMNDNECGLFAQTSGATVENVNLQAGSLAYDGACSGGSGSIVGYAYQSTLTNLHSSMVINSNDAVDGYLGGLVGFMWGNSLSDSSFSGSITDSNSFNQADGGLLGAIQGSTLSDSYNSGTITESSSDQGDNIGGLLGMQLIATTTSNVYSSGTINNVAGAGGMNTGGLIGYASLGSITNAFSASPANNISGSGTITGFNTSGLSYSGIYYDQTATTFGSCTGTGTSVPCTAENVANASPSYFFNKANAPLSSWNFTTTWQTTSSYPILQNLADFNGLSGLPNNGDSTGDGTLDSYQANIGDVEGTDGIWSAVKVPTSTLCTVSNTQTTDSSSAPTYSTSYSLATDLTGYDVYCPTAGQTVSVTIYFSHDFNSSGAELLFYNPSTHQYSPVTSAVFSTATVGSSTDTTVTYAITDGGQYDLDSQANDIIEDPVVLAVPVSAVLTSASAPASGYGAPGSSTAITTVLGVGSIIAIGIGLTIMHEYRKTAKGKTFSLV